MAIYHCTIKIVKRSQGKSAVAAAAYRSGEKLTNEWDGVTHDYIKKGGIVHAEILLPSHAPPELLGIDKIPSVHMGVAATQMERKGIATDKGNLNREIATQNKLLKEIKARITRLYNWSKEQEKQPEKASILDLIKQSTPSKPTSTYGKVKALKESAALFHFLQSNGINSIAELHQKITAMQSDYYALRGEIVSAEREIATLTKHLEIWGQYGANKHPKTDSEKTLLDSAAKYLNELKAASSGITPKKWVADKSRLTKAQAK